MKKKTKQSVSKPKNPIKGKVKPSGRGKNRKRSAKKSSFFRFPSLVTPLNLQYRKVFFLALGLISLLTILIGFQTGINGDEMMHERYSESLFNFYKTFGADKSALNDSQYLMHLYGSFFDVLTGSVSKILGIDIGDPAYFSLRHFFTALCGSLIMLFVGLIVQYIAGWRAAIFALVLMFLSPRFLGHAAMNHKDIPFALGYAMSIYFMLVLIRQLPRPNWKNVLGLVVGMGIALGVRAGGLTLVAYFGLFLAVDFVLKYGISGIGKEKNTAIRYLAYWGGISVCSILFAYLFWPFGLVKPFSNIFIALTEFTNYSMDLRTLFDGEMILAQSIPTPAYLSKWMVFTIPLFSIIGLGLFIGFSKGIINRQNMFPVLAVLFAFLFPIGYVVYKGSTLYSGWRHLLFVYTALIPLVALGWNFVLEKAKTGWVRYALIGIFAVTLIEPAYFIARNYYCSYVYFNPLAGGMNGSFGKYDHDYWGVGMKQAVKYLEKSGILNENMERPLKIAGNFTYNLNVYTQKYGNKVDAVYVKYRERYEKDWDYAIFVGFHVDGAQLRNGSWPSGKTIHSVKVAGVPIVAIYDGSNKTAFEAQKALNNNDYNTAVQLFTQEVANFPDNDLAWLGLASAHVKQGDLVSAKPPLDKALELNPTNPSAMNMLGMYLISQRDYQQARNTFLEAVALNANNHFGYFNLALLEEQENNLDKAIEYALKTIEAKPDYRQGYEVLVQLYQRTGQEEEVRKCLEILSDL